MKNITKRVIPSLYLILFNMLSFIPEPSQANSDVAYKTGLEAAERKALRTTQKTATSQAVSTTLVKQLLGRFYRIGDSWEVAAWQINPTMMRMTGEGNRLQKNLGSGGIFHYEVVSLKSGIQPQIGLEITQISKFGFNQIDPKVSKLQ